MDKKISYETIIKNKGLAEFMEKEDDKREE